MKASEPLTRHLGFVQAFVRQVLGGTGMGVSWLSTLGAMVPKWFCQQQGNCRPTNICMDELIFLFRHAHYQETTRVLSIDKLGSQVC